MSSVNQGNVLGNVSFKGDSMSDFSEFDSQSVMDEYHNESTWQKTNGVMAPTTTIETITVTRPLKVIAFICGLMVMVLLVLALVSNDWLLAAGWRQGLFSYCISENAPTPLPFNVKNTQPDCYKGRDLAYIKIAAALCIVALLTDAVATLLTGIGLRTSDHRTKYKFYRIAVYVMILSLISVLLALVVYPVCFAAELNQGNRQVWEFGWAYGVGWGAAIFLFGAVVLLLCDKEAEEIYYKERKVGGA